MTEPDWAHLESLRMWRVLAAQGNEAGQSVASYHNLAPLPAPATAPTRPAPARAVTPRAPRPTAPAAPQPATPVLSALQGRVATLQKLVAPPPLPPGLLD
jgi:hypothetical protein